MSEQHNGLENDQNLEQKEGQRGSLCCNKESLRCPSFCYHFVESNADVDKAFDILFNEMYNDLKQNGK